MYISMDVDKLKNEEVTDCEGCNASLIVGSIPNDLFIPLPGINVWNRHPIQKQSNAITVKKSKAPNVRNVTICLNCFNGHVTGHKPIPLDVLGIKIVKSPYTNVEKYMKIDGPTKVVNLLLDDYKNLQYSEHMMTEDWKNENQATSIQQNEYNKPMRKRKQIINYDEDNDDADLADEVIERTVPDSEKEEQFIALNLGAPTTVNYLTIGSDMLGAMEMTDD